MDTIATSRRTAASQASEAVVLSRRQLVALAVLMCIPIPLLSFGATVVPLPQILERAAATFVPFLPPTLGEDGGRVARESATAVRAVEIVGTPIEQTVSSPAAAPARTASSPRRSAGRQPVRPVPAENQASDLGDSTQGPPTSGGGEKPEQPPAPADPVSPPADGPSGAPGDGATGGGPAPSGSGGAAQGDKPGQAKEHDNNGKHTGSGGSGGGDPGGSGQDSGQGGPREPSPPRGDGSPPGKGSGGP